MPKARILEIYLNEIFLGAQAYGVAAAAQNYFNKSLDELSLAEAAFLAALPKAPNNYNPVRFPEAAKARRDWVLDRMAEDGDITRDGARPRQGRADRAAPDAPARAWCRSASTSPRRCGASWSPASAPDQTTMGGLVVRTSLDPALQAEAERALRDALLALRPPPRRLARAGRADRFRQPTEWLPALQAVPRPPGMAARLAAGRGAGGA